MRIRKYGYLTLRRPRKVNKAFSVADTLGLGSKRLTNAQKEKMNLVAAFLANNPNHFRALVWIAYKARFKKGRGRFTVRRVEFPKTWIWSRKRKWSREEKRRVLKMLKSLKLIKILKADNSGTQVKILRGKYQVLFQPAPTGPNDGFFNIDKGKAFLWALDHEYPYAMHLLITSAWRSRKNPETGAWYAYIDRRNPDTRPGLTEYQCREGQEDLERRGLIRKELPGRPDITLPKANYWLVGERVEGEVSTLFLDDWFLPEEGPQKPPKTHAKTVTLTDRKRYSPCTENVTHQEPGLDTENIRDSECYLPELLPESGQVHPGNCQLTSPKSKQVFIDRIDSKKEEKTPPYPQVEKGDFSSFLITRPDGWFDDEQQVKDAARILVDALSFTRFLDKSVRDILVNIHERRFSSIADDPEELLRKRRIFSLDKEEERWSACIPLDGKGREQLLTNYPVVLSAAIEHMQSNDWFFPSKVVDFCHKGFAVRHAQKVRDTLSQLDQIVMKLIKFEPNPSSVTGDEPSVEELLSDLLESVAPDPELEKQALVAMCREGWCNELTELLPGISAEVQAGTFPRRRCGCVVWSAPLHATQHSHSPSGATP